MLSADLIRIRIAWIEYTRPHNGLSRWKRERERERVGGRSEATLLVHVYHGSPPRNMIYRGAVGRRSRSRRRRTGLQRFPKIPQASGKSNERRGIGGARDARNVIPRAPRANYVKIWCGSGRLRCSRGLLCAAGSVERTRARNRGKFWHRLVGPPILHVEFNVRARAGLELLRRACRGTRAWFNRPLSKGRAYGYFT